MNVKNKIYNKIGKNYNLTRQPDHRIYNNLNKLLNCKRGDHILDIGAGTGNYTYLFALDNYKIDGLEPSDIMQKNGKKHNNLKWILSDAENIPSKDNFYDGAICTLASHHFNSTDKSFNEIKRVLRNETNFVLFTADPRKVDINCWLNIYFNELVEQAKITLPAIENILNLLENIFNSKPKLIPFYLPYNLTDSFFYSGWRSPEKYLDNNFRNGISSFSMANDNLVLKLINKLVNDLKTGIWDNKYQNIRNLKEYNCGYYFIVIKKINK